MRVAQEPIEDVVDRYVLVVRIARVGPRREDLLDFVALEPDQISA